MHASIPAAILYTLAHGRRKAGCVFLMRTTMTLVALQVMTSAIASACCVAQWTT